jgi:hypothetical protein
VYEKEKSQRELAFLYLISSPFRVAREWSAQGELKYIMDQDSNPDKTN